ncbi:MAG TPA: peptide ABC transporter substrate-binding protein [Chloroflexota bacterium]|nr:peptide ABC transporter substrate-binding protein [Chloroflexota bacterium]
MSRWPLPAVTRRRFLQLVPAAFAAAACQPPAISQPRPVGSESWEQHPGGSITLAVEAEPQTLVPSVGGPRSDAAQHLFNLVHQSLATYDDQGRPSPRVALSLPSLENGTWKVFDDGTMETVWTLRDDVQWHDGEPLTADDVVFSWRVFNDAAVPIGSRKVARLIDAIDAPDSHTVVMHWRARYAFADQITGNDLTLLPSHLLEASYDLRREQLAAHPYWRAQFVGVGPFRVDQWSNGTIRLTAFDAYFLGRPVLNAITVRFLPDSSAAVAALLAGGIDVMLPRRAVPGVVLTLQQRWQDARDGTSAVLPGYSWLFLAPQFSGPQPEDLLDLRVRQALDCSLDRAAIAEAVTGDRSLASDLWVPSADPQYALLGPDYTPTEYDPARARDLFREAGWRRESADDVLVKQGRRFEIELTTPPEFERTSTAVAEFWREAGVAVQVSILNRPALTDRAGRAAYTGVELAGATPSLALIEGRLSSSNIPLAENQWVGANRGHYASTKIDELLDRVWTTIDPQARGAAERELTAQIASELPILGLLFYPAMAAVRSNVRGVKWPRAQTPTGWASATWNAHEWSAAS